jgi:GNAT superfamily N-acetyltransferase
LRCEGLEQENKFLIASGFVDEAKRIGCNAIELSVDPDNNRPHDFYKTLGFRDDRTEIIMVKMLN